MKKIILILSIVAFSSCKSYYNISNFYNAHKNDDKVTAVEVPRFMFSLLKGLSPEMNSTLDKVNNLRYIQLNPANNSAENTIQNEINLLTNERFTDIYRKNLGVNRTLVSVRQQDNLIREIIVHTSANKKHTVLYLSGRFNPQKIQDFAEQGKFDNLTQSLTQQYLWNTTAPISY